MTDSLLIRMIPASARRIIASIGLLAVTAGALAVETKVIRDDTFTQLSQGETTGTELLSDGFLRVAPEAKRLDKTDEAVGWRVAVDRADGQVFYSTGHDGKVYRHVPDGSPELWAKLPEGQAISLAIDPTGAVLVGASPGGKIYRVVQAGKPQLIFETKEQYVWDLVFDRDGVLYAATGPNGKIFRIRGVNNGEVYYDSEATNVMALDFDQNGNLLAATQGKGMVIRVTRPNEAYVMYTSPDDEVRALASDQQSGIVYAAVNGSRASSPLIDTPAADGEGKKASPTASESRPTSTPTPSSARESASPSYIVQIQPSGFVTQFWPSPEAPIHSLLSNAPGPEGGLLVAAGKRGRLYRVRSNANHSVLADVTEPMILSIAAAPDGSTYFTTANKTSLYKLAPPGTTGIFASRTLNAGSTVQWGNIAIDADQTSGTSIVIETRTGNTPASDDKTWSDYTTATLLREGFARIDSPVAQYLQYRLTIESPPDSAGPVIDRVQVYYVQQNAAPVIRSISVSKTSEGGGASALSLLSSSARRSAPESSGRPSGGTDGDGDGAAARSAVLARSLGLSAALAGARGGDEGEGRSAATTGTGAPENTRRYRVSWSATDPNADRLLSNVQIKAEDETVWRQVEEKLAVSNLTLATDTLADGQYRLNVEVTDAPDNPGTQTTTASLISELFTVDNTPPVIRRLKATPTGTPGEWEITAEVADATSILASADYSVDGLDEFHMVKPLDGLFDFVEESFRFRVTPEKSLPEHVLTFRVNDREGNTQIGKVLLK